jgi:hypothetical protein
MHEDDGRTWSVTEMKHVSQVLLRLDAVSVPIYQFRRPILEVKTRTVSPVAPMPIVSSPTFLYLARPRT